MERPTRRAFLAYTGTGAAGLGLAAMSPGVANAVEAAARVDEPDVDPTVTGGEPLLASVTDLRTGELTVILGAREVSVVDHDLAQRIARISQTGA
jgi:hypothetical protein